MPDVVVAGATYPDVPAVVLPKTGGGTSRFDDTTDANATAADIASGKTAYVNGVKLTGTGSGGGGLTLLGSKNIGTISTSSTTATDTGITMTVKGIYDYDLLICQSQVATKTNGRHVATTRLVFLSASTSIDTKTGNSIAAPTWNVKLSSSGVASSRTNNTAYGVYANTVTVSAGSTGDNGQADIAIYQRYNSSNTGTINGNYTMYVYGVKLWDLI